jgi:uridine kinase
VSNDSESGISPRLPLVLGIAGCSGSGKTTLAAELARLLDGIHFPLDNYYRDLSHLTPAARERTDFDDPDIIESPLLAADVGTLARGEAIERPLYDFATHTRVTGRTETVQPGAVVLVEGIFALCYSELLPLYHLRIFMETPDDICYERRLRRDMLERGRSAESVRQQYEATVRPSSVRWVRPSAAHADLVLDGTDDLDWKVERVLSELHRRELGWPHR